MKHKVMFYYNGYELGETELDVPFTSEEEMAEYVKDNLVFWFEEVKDEEV